MLLRYTTARQRKLWLVGQEAKTPPSHGGIRGSIPLQATMNVIRKEWAEMSTLSFIYKKTDILLERGEYCMGRRESYEAKTTEQLIQPVD